MVCPALLKPPCKLHYFMGLPPPLLALACARGREGIKAGERMLPRRWSRAMQFTLACSGVTMINQRAAE